MPRSYGSCRLIEWRDGNYGNYGVGAPRGATGSGGAAACATGAARAIAGGVSGERVDASGVRAARGHPVYDVLQLDAARGEAGWCGFARGGVGSLRGGGVADEREHGRRWARSAFGRRHDRARRPRR